MSDNPNKLPKPESGGKPKNFADDMKNPGGPSTPGAKARRKIGSRAQKFQATMALLKGEDGAAERMQSLKKAQADREKLTNQQSTDSDNGGFT